MLIFRQKFSTEKNLAIRPTDFRLKFRAQKFLTAAEFVFFKFFHEL